jgi:glycosyltransferase involved in cell wall biosynthesis
MDQLPLISVCIPTFNGSLYLNETLASVADQTYKNIELIISDDLSEDNTLEIAEKFKSEATFPVFIYHHQPQGIGANWNNCIQKSNGNYIKFIFQDDFMEPTCLEEMLSAIAQTHTKICVCKRNIIVDEIYQNKESIIEWLHVFDDLQKDIYLKEKNNNKLITKAIFSDKNFLVWPYNKIGEPIVGLIEKSVFEEIGMYNIKIKQFLDYEFWYRVLIKYDFVFLEKKLVNFRVHFLQTTKINERNMLNEFPLYLNFVEKNLKNMLDPDVRKQWFGVFPILKRKIRRILGK